MIIGRRYDLTEMSWTAEDAPQLWDYGTHPGGYWYAITPAGMANLDAHQVVEYEDRTITVSPSILVGVKILDPTSSQPSWHGFLERGVWREA